MMPGNMFWPYTAVAVLTGVNLLTLPIMLGPLLWGGVFSIMFIWINHLGIKFKSWLGILWIICTAVVAIYILNGQTLGVEMRIIVSTFSCASCCWCSYKEYRKMNVGK